MGALVLSPFVDRARYDAVAAELVEQREGWHTGYGEGLADMRGAVHWEARSLAARLPHAALLDLVRQYLRNDLGEHAAERLWPGVRALDDHGLVALFADLFTHAAERDL
jgi:hypothetical protein